MTRDASVLARRYDNAAARAGGNIDMRIDTALADEFKARQPFKQISLDFGALANEHQAFDVLQARRQRVSVLHMIVPDDNLVPF